MKRLFLLFVLLLASPVEAQHEQDWLARYCVNEAGWQIDKPWHQSTHKNDCSAMARSLKNNYRRAELRTWMMRHYGPNVFNYNRDSRRYIPFLRPTTRPPRYWPDANWLKHLRRYKQIYELAGKILRGTIVPPASCNPHHWGASSLDRRSRRRGWVKQDCGPTLNHYWNVPSRGLTDV